MYRKGFTLIELLVVVAIIGLISSTVFTNIRGGVNKAKAANTATALDAIHDAFIYKSLDENITEWWHEDDFPSTSSWAAYIEDLVNDDIISTFLPSAPDYPNTDPENFFEYAYDQDDDVFVNPSGDACFDHTETFSGNWSQWNQLRGVNVVVYPGLHPDSREFRESFEFLDNAIDKGDGPYCGRMRHDAFNEGHSSNDSRRHHYFRYAIDYDLKPDF